MSQPNLNEDLNIVSNSNLTIAYLDGNLDIIQQLDDEPNDVGGLTSAELKAKFDEAGNVIKTYINDTLIPAILAEDATEEARASAEAARETAEQARASAEEERAAAEQARVEAENGRVSAEAARVTAEQERAAAEQARADENTGIVAQATAQAEAAEAAKKSAESAATSALSYKSAAYSSAVLAGQERGAAEQAKINAEAAHGKAEAAKDAAIASETAAKASETAAAASAKAAAASAARAEEIAGGDFATKTELGAHTGNADVHVTAEEKAAWNESDVFIAVYGETTATEIIEAFNAGKFVVCKKSKQFGLLENVISTNIVRFKVLNNGADYSADYSTVLAEYPVCTTWLVSGSTWTANNISGSHLHASTHSSGGSDPITPESIGAAEIPKCVSVTLSASGWDSTTKTKTVTVTGVSATETAQLITPVPALASQAAYYDAGIKCTGQAANSLTFTADTVPTADLTVYVTIQEVSA